MLKVLLADDNPHAQRMGAEILSQEGFEVLGVTGGREALESLERFAPDLVLADVCMPEHSGYEICERIKANPALERVKVVLLVGASEALDRARAASAGADGVLQKPFEPSAVMDLLAPLMGRVPARRAPPKQAGSGPAGKEEFEQAVQAVLDRERMDRDQVRAAVMLALELALPGFVDDLTERVLEALRRAGR
ncbi:MAG TPA: response regulator [Bryobacterales bacterium]|nr:response regulator [Bryobacterales bacterium]